MTRPRTYFDDRLLARRDWLSLILALAIGLSVLAAAALAPLEYLP